jgi:translation initiation factor 6 (eIF-6)
MAKPDKSSSAKEKLVTSIWSTAVGMVALVGIFGRGHPVALAVPPIAAAVTTAFVLNTEEKRQQLPAQTETLQRIESRLEALETIITQEDYLLADRFADRSQQVEK